MDQIMRFQTLNLIMKDKIQSKTIQMRIMMSIPAEWSAIIIIEVITLHPEANEKLQKKFQLIIAVHKQLEIYAIDILVISMNFF